MVHVEEAGMTPCLFTLNTEQTIYIFYKCNLSHGGTQPYGRSALYMVVMQRVGRLPRKSIISL